MRNHARGLKERIYICPFQFVDRSGIFYREVSTSYNTIAKEKFYTEVSYVVYKNVPESTANYIVPPSRGQTNTV
jgi:hypothetical protein